MLYLHENCNIVTECISPRYSVFSWKQILRDNRYSSSKNLAEKETSIFCQYSLNGSLLQRPKPEASTSKQYKMTWEAFMTRMRYI